MTRSLTAEEWRRIESALATIERQTAAKLRVIVVPVSDRYSLFPLVWGQLGALLILGIVAALRPGLGIRSSILI